VADYQSTLKGLASCWFCLLLQACSGESPAPAKDPMTAVGPRLLAWQLEQSIEVSDATEQLVKAVDRFTDLPNEETHAQLQSEWIEAHNHWLEASMLTQLNVSSVQLIDAWPLLPGFIDSLPGYPHSGIVNDMTLPMTSEVLRAQHQITDVAEVALGFHVIEYYAFTRTHQEFTGASERRKQYLNLVSDLLLLEILAFTQAAGVPQDDGQLLLILRDHIKSMFSTLSHPGGHNIYSGEGRAQAVIQLRAIDSLLNEPVGLNYRLLTLDADHTMELADTLDKTIRLLESAGEPDETEVLSRLSDLSDLLESFAER
jgi:hypothetical protein